MSCRKEWGSRKPFQIGNDSFDDMSRTAAIRIPPLQRLSASAIAAPA
jgi:hypothetical protein